jgi:membrane-bound lytic murein transglycosylase F
MEFFARYCRVFLLFFLGLLLSGCDQPPSSSEQKLAVTSPSSSVAQPVVPLLSTDDLSALRARGHIRFLIPRFDGLNALPRDGLPVLDYQDLARTFAESLQLEAEWVFVDDFAQLIPALKAGRGDVIVTNMTATESRSEVVAFSREIAQVSEWVITRKDNPVDSLEDMANQTVTLVKGTAYADTLEQQQFAGTIAWYEGNNPIDILSDMESGKYQATVMDSDVAGVVLSLYPSLRSRFSISRHRPIAWAIRPDNPELLLKLNEFLVAHHVQAATNHLEPRDWAAIKASGRLRMLTLNNPASYFMWRGELMGFDYELVKAFAKEHKLHLAVVLKHSIPELFEALKQGEGDVIAASLTATKEREAMGVAFSRPYLYVSEQVIGRKQGPVLETLEQLTWHRVVANPDTVFFPRLKTLFAARALPVTLEVDTPAASTGQPDAASGLAEIPVDDRYSVVPEPEGELLAVRATTENLVTQVLDGQYDFTVADSHLAAVEASYHRGLITPLALQEESPIAWGVRPDQPALTKQLNAFVKHQYRGLFYNVTFNKYFKDKRTIRRYQAGRLQEGGALSPYDALVQAETERYGMDWRMLVSQMYQESKFNPKAVSFAGAEGLMQVMPRTARELGYSDLFKPENGIAAGAAYMHWLEDRFPGNLDVQERLYFTLAAYNAGTGHVRDARKLARQLGLDANRWFGQVEKAMLKLSQPKYYKRARFGYVRGSEPVTYVRQIRDRYLGYLANQEVMPEVTPANNAGGPEDVQPHQNQAEEDES